MQVGEGALGDVVRGHIVMPSGPAMVSGRGRGIDKAGCEWRSSTPPPGWRQAKPPPG